MWRFKLISQACYRETRQFSSNTSIGRRTFLTITLPTRVVIWHWAFILSIPQIARCYTGLVMI
ncbi:hypothetical protein LINPERHAP2_LOCUS3759 [Linum perenne]